MIERAAALDHNNDDKLAGLAAANEGAAQLLAQLNGEADGPAMRAAQSAVWRNAIEQRLQNGQHNKARELLERIQGDLHPDDLRSFSDFIESRTDRLSKGK